MPEIEVIARQWFRKYKGEYIREDLFTAEDLAQEIVVELLDNDFKDKKKIIIQANRIADRLRKRGSIKPVEVPLSQLDRGERGMVNNLFYGDFGEDDYSEESFP